MAEKTKGLSAIDISEIAHDSAELYEPVAEDCGLTFATEIAAGVEIKGNRELVGQALGNLIDNAVKYAEGSGGEPEIRISLARREGAAHDIGELRRRRDRA